MAISEKIKSSMEKSSWIRKMFEEGIELKQKFGAENVFDFSLGNPDVPPPAEFFKVFSKYAADETPGVHGYMPNAGFPDVRERIAEKASREHNVSIGASNIVMTVGAAGGLNVIFKTILNPEDEVIVQAPYFVEYNSYVGNHGGTCVAVEPNDSLSLNIDGIKKAITSKTKAVLINSPHNPTGVIYPEAEIIELAAIIKEESVRKGEPVYLISDEPYREIVYDGAVVPSILDKYADSMVVTSYSKTLSIPGERIGYIALGPEISDLNMVAGGLALSNRILGYVNAPAVLQRTVADLNDAAVATDIYAGRRKLLLEALDGVGIEYVKPSGAFYVFAKAPGGDDIEFVNYLKKYNILAVPGTGFGGPGYFRLSYCISEDIIKRSAPFFKKAMIERG